MKKRSGFGWLELVEGILLILLSIYTIIWPDRALTGWIVLYGLIAVIMGVADILLYIRVERFTGFGPILSLVSGALSVMTGVMLLVYPNAGKWVMSLLFPLWFLTHCISNLTHLNWVRLTAGRVNYTISLVLNILGIVLATLMLLHPVLSAVSMSLTIGFYLILLGVDGIVLALSSMGR